MQLTTTVVMLTPSVRILWDHTIVLAKQVSMGMGENVLVNMIFIFYYFVIVTTIVKTMLSNTSIAISIFFF